MLLDTHIAIWTLFSPELLTAAGRDLIADSDNDIYVSVVSVWEIAIKHALGRANAPPISADKAIEEFEVSGFTLMPITAVDAAATQRLPLLHRDPFDRLLVAQALAGPMSLLTRDANLPAYSDLVVRV